MGLRGEAEKLVSSDMSRARGDIISFYLGVRISTLDTGLCVVQIFILDTGLDTVRISTLDTALCVVQIFILDAGLDPKSEYQP